MNTASALSTSSAASVYRAPSISSTQETTGTAPSDSAVSTSSAITIPTPTLASVSTSPSLCIEKCRILTDVLKKASEKTDERGTPCFSAEHLQYLDQLLTKSLAAFRSNKQWTAYCNGVIKTHISNINKYRYEERTW